MKAISLTCGGTTIIVFSTPQMGDATQLTFLNAIVLHCWCTIVGAPLVFTAV